MQIVFYSGFTKKKNSTKKPPEGQTNITLTGTLKQNCSVLNPMVQIKRVTGDVVPQGFTYAYISSFNRYYFVTDWTWNEPFWECSMTVDVLASWKTQIGLQTEYILRTDTTDDTVYSPWICDVAYPGTSYFTKAQTLFPNYPFSAAYTGGVAAGTYILGIISGETTGSSVGAITYYAMTSAQFAALKGILFGDGNLVVMGLAEYNGNDLEPLITDMSLEMTKAMYNPYQYVASCMWFPISISDISNKTAVTSIKLGWWSYPAVGYIVNAQYITFGQHATPPAHPQASTRGKYLNYAPYTRRKLLGVAGEQPIDCSFIGEHDNIALTWNVDLITGQCRLDVFVYNSEQQEATNYRIMQRDFLIGVPIQLAQIATDYLGVAVAAVDSAAGVMSAVRHLDPGAALSATANGVYNTLNASMPQMATSGANGSFLVVNNGIGLISEFVFPTDEDIHHKGRPVYRNMQISNLSGYILCAEGEFDISCMDDEREMISNFMTTGFFWE